MYIFVLENSQISSKIVKIVQQNRKNQLSQKDIVNSHLYLHFWVCVIAHDALDVKLDEDIVPSIQRTTKT